jgi:DNA-binding MarR family transcriptional regulator
MPTPGLAELDRRLGIKHFDAELFDADTMDPGSFHKQHLDIERSVMRDTVDELLTEWREQRPDLDCSPMGVVGRISRASRLLEQGVNAYFAEHGVESWEFDVLATLRRAGEPYQRTMGELVAAAMISSAAATNRVDRLVAKGLIEREVDPDNRRRVLVRLTPAGLRLVNKLLAGHVENERRLLAQMPADRLPELAGLLRTLLVALGDAPHRPA